MLHFVVFILGFLSLLSAVVTAPLPAPEGIASLETRATHSGRGTFFYVGEGNCGWTSTDNQYVVAMSKSFYDTNGGSNCGQTLNISWGGKTATATMVDSCPGCGYYDLDMSPSLFEHFAKLSVGVLNGLEWHFNAK